MANPEEQLERLAAIDALHASASDAFDTKVREAQEAAEEEAAVGLERVNKYQEVLGAGFIIERVVEPSAVTYMAGYTRYAVGGLFGGWQYDERWFALDESHAEKLAGKTIMNARLNLSREPRLTKFDQEPQAHRELGIEFTIPGVYWRLRNKSRLAQPLFTTEPGYERPTDNQYSAPLSAIEWRLATEEEILQVNQTVVATKG